MLIRGSAYRLCIACTNHHLGRNELLEVFPDDLQEHFGDILRTNELLRRAYVPRRYRPRTRSGMNTEDAGQFGNNDFSRWDHRGRRWVPAPPPPELNDLRATLAPIIEDRAAEHVVLELFRLARHVERDPVQAAERLVFIQAGIGSGKSTLINHLVRVIAPLLRERRLGRVDLLPVIVDLNNYDGDEDVASIWEKVLAELQAGVAAIAGIRTTDDWHRIARPEIYDASGQLLPHLATASDPEAAVREVVHLSHKPVTFIQRVARHVFDAARPAVIVLLLDNVDRQAEVSKQVQLISRFHALLAQTQLPLGAAAVREDSLGNLAHSESFRAFFHVNRMHVTTPFIGEMVRKRFELCLDDPRLRDRPWRIIRLRNNVTVGPLDLEGIFRSVATAFGADTGEPEINRDPETHLMTSREGRPQVADFLNQVTNSNGRASLSFVLEAMRSWALQHEGIIVEYLFQRDQLRKRGYGVSDPRMDPHVRLPTFTVDELLRLVFVGEHRYYDHDKCPHLFNLFARGGDRPQPRAGRIPALYTYRIFQYLDGVGGRTTMTEILTSFRCFGYTRLELEDTLTELMRGGFIESPDGSDLTKAKTIFTTRKLDFYLDQLSKMLVYLENVRNDCVIDYESMPHEPRSPISEDLFEVLKFIAFLADQERDEYEYVKTKRTGCLVDYCAIATGQPVSWRLLKSVCRRSNTLFQRRPDLFTRSSRRSSAEVGGLLRELRRTLLERSAGDLIWPRIPDDDRDEVYLRWIEGESLGTRRAGGAP